MISFLSLFHLIGDATDFINFTVYHITSLERNQRWRLWWGQWWWWLWWWQWWSWREQTRMTMMTMMTMMMMKTTAMTMMVEVNYTLNWVTRMTNQEQKCIIQMAIHEHVILPSEKLAVFWSNQHPEECLSESHHQELEWRTWGSIQKWR